MYGLLIEAIVHYLKQTYGDEKWEEIRKKANLTQMSFATHERYSENVIPVLAKAASEVTGHPVDELMDAFGVSFVSFVAQYGYDRILKVLGRHLRDFLNGLDNLHEYLRFSYPKLRAPSFFCENESQYGLTLHYRSKRRGFLHYVKGQIRQVAKTFYKTKVDVDVISENCIDGMSHIIYKLHFDNIAYREATEHSEKVTHTLPLHSDVFFELFPFHIVFNREMVIRNIGAGLMAVMPSIVFKPLNGVFKVTRPVVAFTWANIMAHTNNVFELVSIEHVQRNIYNLTSCTENGDSEDEKMDTGEDGQTMDTTFFIDEEGNCLHLKGQMMFMPEWDCIIFLGTPIMESLDTMFTTGLYINDLSMHDSSRDLVLAGTQQSAELKLALDQEQQKSKILEESMKKLDSEMKRTDQLLYQMIPKAVADRLRRGEPAINTCQVFDNVTILFSDVVGFTNICSQISPMEVVSMLNAMYTMFDQLSEKHNVYKVETIGDAYMVVCGAPDVTPYHSLYVCDMALDMLKSMNDLRDPSTSGNMKIRVGVHSGNTVAGVVGIKMPRYCLFGDTVNTASRMETNGEAMKIHISETTYKELKPYPYIVQERGTITVKGKGTMKTYWLLAKNPDGKPICPFSSVIMDELAKADHVPDGIEHLGNVERSESVEIRNVYSPVSFADVARNKSSATTPGSSPVKASLYKHNFNNVDQYQKPDPNYMKIIEIKSPTNEKHNIVDRMKYSNEKQNNFDNRGRHPISNNDYNDDADSYRSQTCILL